MPVEPKELVVISGKGGTGKTSIVASFAALAQKAVLADCDVDAADLHLVLKPKIIRRENFSGGKRARIKSSLCKACGKCQELCRFAAVYHDGPASQHAAKTFRIDPIACEGCGVCAWFCPEQAIEFKSVINGKWFVSETRWGPMVHAKLGIAEENSGKLVSTVRTAARKIATQRGLEMIIVDGSPGIGCPVIASISGARLVLIVAEPSLSGKHDMARVAELTRYFNVPAMLAINKWDLNPQVADEIETLAHKHGIHSSGRVRYDRGVTDAQLRRLAVVEHQQDGCAEDIHKLWSRLLKQLNKPSFDQKL